MEDTGLIVAASGVSLRRPGVREYVAIGFRWRVRSLVAFVLTALCGVLFALHSQPSYQSVMKILVKRERVDPLVAPDQLAASAPRDITEEELNSELELIRSEDVLRKVVLTTGMQKVPAASRFHFSGTSSAESEQVRTAKAIQQLLRGLYISLPKKTNVITVIFGSPDPRLSVSVLNALSKFYFEKHLAVHRPAGQVDFFERQAEQARRNLEEVQATLRQSARQSGNFAGAVDLDLAVQKLAEQRLTLQQTSTAIREAEQRIGVLEQQLKSTPPRMTTAVREDDNSMLMTNLKSTLLQLELKRTELLQKFQPKYRTVQEVDEQIAQTRAAISAAQSAPIMGRTTDRDPTYEWTRSELVKAEAELISLRSRAASVAKYTAEYTERARRLSEGNLQQQQLLATAKALEESYQLYLRKREEARISDALDQNKFLNVSLAQLPSMPVLPTGSPLKIVLVTIPFAVFMSLGAAIVSEHLDNSFRTPDEVQRYLDIPVVAALPPFELDGKANPAKTSS